MPNICKWNVEVVGPDGLAKDMIRRMASAVLPTPDGDWGDFVLDPARIGLNREKEQPHFVGLDARGDGWCEGFPNLHENDPTGRIRKQDGSVAASKSRLGSLRGRNDLSRPWRRQRRQQPTRRRKGH